MYDANGNKVEENVSGTIHEYVSAFGVTAQMTMQTEDSTIVPLPGGVQALYSGGMLQRFRYPDWQGSIRAESNASPTNRVFTESLAFAPFGERYVLKGAPFNVDSFTGKPDQLVPDEYDFPAREEHNGQGRWVSPDPMRGTGNKYVYADNNPLSNVDLYGLFPSNEGVDYTGDDGISSDPSSEPLYQEESHPSVSVQTSGQSTQTQSSGVDHSEDGEHNSWWRWFHNHGLLFETQREQTAALKAHADLAKQLMRDDHLYIDGKPVDEALKGKSNEQVLRIFDDYKEAKLEGKIPQIAGPSMPPGMSNSDFGSVMKWGSGDDAARARVQTLTREELDNAGVTKDMAGEWRDFYKQVKAANPGNPSAQGRAELMQKAYELLGGEN